MDSCFTRRPPSTKQAGRRWCCFGKILSARDTILTAALLSRRCSRCVLSSPSKVLPRGKWTQRLLSRMDPAFQVADAGGGRGVPATDSEEDELGKENQERLEGENLGDAMHEALSGKGLGAEEAAGASAGAGASRPLRLLTLDGVEPVMENSEAAMAQTRLRTLGAEPGDYVKILVDSCYEADMTEELVLAGVQVKQLCSMSRALADPSSKIQFQRDARYGHSIKASNRRLDLLATALDAQLSRLGMIRR
eukprot:scaffold279_cov229-Pinguiococcus_pyrenoidosus.AAC.10